MPLTHRPDFKQALSTLHQLQQQAGEEPHVPTYSHKHKQWEDKVHLLHGGIGKVHGGLLINTKVKKEMNQLLSEQCDPLLAVFGKLLRK